MGSKLSIEERIQNVRRYIIEDIFVMRVEGTDLQNKIRFVFADALAIDPNKTSYMDITCELTQHYPQVIFSECVDIGVFEFLRWGWEDENTWVVTVDGYDGWFDVAWYNVSHAKLKALREAFIVKCCESEEDSIREGKYDIHNGKGRYRAIINSDNLVSFPKEWTMQTIPVL